MPPETYALVDHTRPNLIPGTTKKLDQSGSSSVFPDWVVVGEESLASSSDATQLQEFWPAFRLFLDVPHERGAFLPAISSLRRLTARQIQRAPYSQEPFPKIWYSLPILKFETRRLRETLLDMFSYPAFVDSSGGFFFEYSVAEPLVAGSPARARLDSDLRASFEAEPLEDGMSHPAEKIIDQVLQSGEGQSVLRWLREFCLNAAQPSFAASVLLCLGRQTHLGTSSWRAELVNDGLAMEDVEIRDAAVQAAESWEDQVLIDVLESHSELVTWLQDYIRDVINDLRQ